MDRTSLRKGFKVMSAFYAASLLFFFDTLVATAASTDTTFNPISPIPGVTTGQTFPFYIDRSMNVIIGVAIVLTVVMIIWGGVEYVTSGGGEKKRKAKDRIQNAVGGLLLVLASVLLLQTINPNIIRIANLEPITINISSNDWLLSAALPKEAWSYCVISVTGNVGDCFVSKAICDEESDNNYIPDKGCEYKPWYTLNNYRNRYSSKEECEADAGVGNCNGPSSTGDSTEGGGVPTDGTFDPIREQQVRSQLAQAGITINKSACTDKNDRDCTSVADLPPETIARLIQMKQDCDTQFSGCSVVVTGGSEGGHETHNPGEPMVDIRYTSGTSLEKFLHSRNMSPTDQTRPSSLGVWWCAKGIGRVLMETNPRNPDSAIHWHIEFQAGRSCPNVYSQ